MNDDPIPIDDPRVLEVMSDLHRQITQCDLDALECSLQLRERRATWLDCITCDDGFVWGPRLGRTWRLWFHMLANGRIPVRPVLALLADAGVLGTRWTPEARDRVFAEQEWL